MPAIWYREVLLALLVINFMKCSFAFHIQLRPSTPVTFSPTLLFSSPSSVPQENELLPLTPTQITFLRKEINRRRAHKKLARLVLPDEESDGAFTTETLSEIASLLEEEELVDVRRICINDKTSVYTTSDILAYELSRNMDTLVERVLTKGHSTVFFAPMGKIVLRTSFQPGAWTKRPKPLRDNRGQIIRVPQEEEG